MQMLLVSSERANILGRRPDTLTLSFHHPRARRDRTNTSDPHSGQAGHLVFFELMMFDLRRRWVTVSTEGGASSVEPNRMGAR